MAITEEQVFDVFGIAAERRPTPKKAKTTKKATVRRSAAASAAVAAAAKSSKPAARRGRPPKDEPRNQQVKGAFTEHERAMIDQLPDLTGESLSELVRRPLLALCAEYKLDRKRKTKTKTKAKK